MERCQAKLGLVIWVSALISLATACSHSRTLGVDAGSESPAATESTATSGLSQEGRQWERSDLVGCPDDVLEYGHLTDPVDHLIDTDSWWRVVAANFDEYDSDEVWSYVTFTAEPVVAGVPVEDAAQDLLVRLLTSTRGIFEYGLTEDLPVYLGLHETPNPLSSDPANLDGSLAIVFVEQADGSPFFGGDCAMYLLSGLVTSEHTEDEMTELTNVLISMTKDELAKGIAPKKCSTLGCDRRGER